MLRSLIIAFCIVTLLSCGNKMQQLESAGEKVKQCVSNCSLSPTSVNDDKKNKEVSSETTTDQQTGGGDRVSNGWNNRLNLW